MDLLPTLKLLFEPILENGKSQGFRNQLGQHQKALQVAATAFKLNLLPLFYQACLSAQRSQIHWITLKILVELLQKERQVSLERLATLFAQPIGNF